MILKPFKRQTYTKLIFSSCNRIVVALIFYIPGRGFSVHVSAYNNIEETCAMDNFYVYVFALCSFHHR